MNVLKCTFCTMSAEEDEIHFLIKCEQYKDIRQNIINKISSRSPNFDSFNVNDALDYLLNVECVHTSKCIVSNTVKITTTNCLFYKNRLLMSLSCFHNCIYVNLCTDCL